MSLCQLFVGLFLFFFLDDLLWVEGFPAVSDSKEFACNVGDLGLIPGLGRTPGEEQGNPLQYSCLKNPMDKEEPGGL